MQAARVAHLDVIEGRARVLLIGDGDGRFLRALVERAPAASVDVVEASGRMIELARQELPEGCEVRFHHLPLASYAPEGQFDFIVSHFFLDCFDEAGIAAVVDRVGAWLRPGGCWLISDFQLPRMGWMRRFRARVLLRVMYSFFRLAAGLDTVRLVDPDRYLDAAGFRLESRETSNGDFLRADRWRR